MQVDAADTPAKAEAQKDAESILAAIMEGKMEQHARAEDLPLLLSRHAMGSTWSPQPVPLVGSPLPATTSQSFAGN